ncbi:PKD domain-containing protein [Pedobacter xixiisoli]|nr:PKD domain-containing protein [Pedobacter xixiisoli]
MFRFLFILMLWAFSPIVSARASYTAGERAIELLKEAGLHSDNYVLGANVNATPHKTTTYSSYQENTGIFNANFNIPQKAYLNRFGFFFFENSSKDFRYFGIPTASFTHNSTGIACGTENVTFTNNSVDGVSYFWDFGDGSNSTDRDPTHLFTAPLGIDKSEFVVRLTVTAADGTTATSTQNISIKQLPDVRLRDRSAVSQFSNCFGGPSITNPNYTISLANISPNSAGIVSYTVNWGDGTVVTDLTNASFPITHTYTALGIFPFSIIATGANGCTNTKTYSIINQSNPAGSFGTSGSTTGLCAPATLPFTISNWEGNSPGTVYEINYGDGTTETLQHPLNTTGGPFVVNHVYRRSSCPERSFTATLTIRNACDVTPFTIGNIQVFTPAVADFEIPVSRICLGNSITFLDRTIRETNPACSRETTYYWEFGDGQTSTEINPTHTYTAIGTYEVKLTTTNFCGTSVRTKTVCVNPVPVASFTLPAAGCVPFVLKPTNTSNSPIPNCGENTYQWSVTSKAQTDCDQAPSLPTYVNGTSSASENPEFNFTTPGIYTIQLVITNSDGSCVSVPYTQDITIKARPEVRFNSPNYQVCEGSGFTPTITIKNCYSVGPVQYAWTFPGSTTPTSNLENPTNIIYPTKGTYTVGLTVTTECGSVSTSTNITVNEVPILNPITDITQCNGVAIPTTNFSTSTTGAATYTWTNSNTAIGLAASGVGNLPSFIARNTGTTPITATITVTPTATIGSCGGVPRTFTITVNPNVEPANAGTDLNLCDVTSAQLNATPAATGGFWSVVTGIGLTFADANQPNTTVNGLVPGNSYVIKWTVRGYPPCGDSESRLNITVSRPTLAGTTTGDNIYCGTSGSGNIILSGHVGSVIRWEQSTNETTWTAVTPANTTPTLNYNNITTTTFFRAVVRSGGCGELASNATKIQITPKPPIPATTLNYTYCLNETATQLTAIGTDLKWYRAPLNSANLLTEAPTPITSTAGTFTFYVTQTVDGCESDPATITVRVNPTIANNNISADQTICLNSTAALLRNSGAALAGGSGSYTYQWQISANGTDFTDITLGGNGLDYQPVAVTADSYYRRIVTSGTCSSTSNTIKITVQGELTSFNISANQTICYSSVPAKLIGEVPVGGSGTYNYVWQQSTVSAATGFTTISGATDVDYQPTALTQTTYYRRTVNSGSCNATSSVVTVKVTPQVSVQQLPDVVSCVGANQSGINFSANLSSANVSYEWTNNETGIGLATSGTGAIPSFVTTNAVKRPLIATITYKAIYTEDGVRCESPSKSFNITILPSIAITSALVDQTLCSGVSAAAIPLTSDQETFAGASVSYRWASSVAIGLTNGTGSQIPSFTTINSTTSPITSTITVTPLYTYGGRTCEGVPTTYQITINPAPRVDFSIPNQTICSGTASDEVDLTSATSNVTISWTATPVAGITGLQTSGSNTIPIQNLANTTNAPITITYVAKATTNGDAACEGILTEYRITVNPVPVVTASATNKTICSNENVNVSLSSNVTGTSFSWTVTANANVTGIANGSGISINQVLVNTSTVPQTVTYTVVPTFTNGSVNCNGVPVDINVIVNPAPIVTYSASNAEICSGQTTAAVTLSSVTPNAVITWEAIVPTGITGMSTISGNANIPAETLVNTTNLPLTVVYRATAKTNDANACAGFVAEYRVIVNPQARLTNTVLSQQICSGAFASEVLLQSNVVGTSFSWTATSSSASVTGFAASGTGNIPRQQIVNSSTETQRITYQITLNAYGCEGTSAVYEILISPSPVFTSSVANTEICSGGTFNYTPTSSTSGVTFRWTRAAVPGISNSAATGTGVDAAATISEVLINTTVNPIDVTYEYEMSINGCSSGIRIPIVVTVNPQATANFGLSPVNGCSPLNLVIKNLNSRALPATYTVDFGDGSPIEVYNDTRDITHIYENNTSTVRLFYVTITTRNECGESISRPYEIRVQPQTVFSRLVLDATQSFGCSPFTVDFTSTNQSTGGNLFTWDFGDGSPIRQTRTVNENITHTFAAPGDYTVTLTATNGCSTVSSTETITVYPQINTDFRISTPQECVNKEVSFTNLSDPQFTSLWDFGDGTTSTEINPKHTYTTPGVKTVTLRSTRIYPNGGTCSTIAVRTIEILAAPAASFTTNSGSLNCGPFTLEVRANGTNAINVEWDFGDPTSANNTAVGLSASHTYITAGDYVVTSRTYNSQGCSNVSTQIIRITESPIANFSASTDNICGTTGNVNFRNETTFGGTGTVTYKWFVNNAQVATSTDLNHAFIVPTGATLPYIFTVKLEASNIVGCKTTQEKTVQFNPLPRAVFNLAQTRGCAPFTLQINNQSTNSDQYEWYLDGALVSTLRNPTDIVLSDFDRTYSLRLLVKNQYGCTENEQIVQVSTYAFLKAEFDVANDLSCNGVLDLQITNRSVGATTYTWDYGDGSPIYVGSNPTHSYGRQGVFTLKLTASNGFCSDIFTKTITVSNPVRASFSSDVRNGCNQLTVRFRNTSINATEYYWDFGDGSFSREENPQHQYASSSTSYTVKLIATNQYGCRDEVSATNFVTVLPPPQAIIQIAPSSIIKVPDYSFQFKAVTTDDIILYRWEFGDGTGSDRSEVTHKYDRFGTYNVKLHITNRANCTTIIEEQVTILDFPGYLYIPNAFEPENLNNDLKVFKVKGSGLATYHFKVFNKWGQMIWQTTKLDDQGAPIEHWDGMHNGQLLPIGAYFWQAEATFINGGVWKGMKYGNKSESKNGVIHLIR